MKNENKYAAPALDKGLDILEYLSRVGAPQSQVEIAEALERSATEIFRMLARLEYRGYIIREGGSGRYQLSLKLYHLSHTHSPVESLRRSALPHMQDLANIVGHPSHLSVIDGDSLLVIAQVRSSNPVSLSIAEGSRFPLLTTTSGMLLLGSVRDDERKRILENSETFQKWSKAKKTSYAAKLETIALSGICHADSEITQGVSDIAARIGEIGSPVLASLAVSSVTSMVGQPKVSDEKLQDAIKEAAKRITEANGLSK